jgi:hypothetical protein
MADAALDALNTMLDGWAVDRLLTWTRPTIPLTLVPGHPHYSWGLSTPAADIVGEPPVRLELCTLVVDANPPYLEWPLEVVDQATYTLRTFQKGLTSTYPSLVYLEMSQPVAQLCVWPVPDTAYTLHLLPWQASAPYEHWDHALSWPNGYLRTFQYNLAVELGPQYMVEAPPTVQRIAEESKRALYVPNVEVGRLSLRPGRLVGGTPLGYPRGFLSGLG